ncbi:MAG: undecaprenyl-diphosphate phosphatase [Parcubacteria group bacterium]
MTSEIIQSAALGLAQGLGEFLPISSSAHLVILPWLFGFSDPGLAFDVALHFGTLVAVLGYFWRDWLDIFRSALLKKESRMGYAENMLWLLMAATIPGAIIGLALESKAETVFRNPLLIAVALSAMGLALYITDKKAKQEKGMSEIGWKEALSIGFSQAIAIIPGISRSGITITTGLIQGLDRVSAARFSFLLSTPIIFGAAILKMPRLFESGMDMGVFTGILVSAASGYLAIRYLMRFVEKTSYRIFFWYRIIFAAVIIAVYATRI